MCLGTSLGGKSAGQNALYQFEEGERQVDASLLEKASVYHIADELMAYHDIVGASYVISTACSASNNAVILIQKWHVSPILLEKESIWVRALVLLFLSKISP